MKAVFGSDEITPLTDAVVGELVARGYELELVGPLGDGEEQWADVGLRVGERALDPTVDLAIAACWTGTGASIAANKVAGVRAALCVNAEVAEGARKWNDANVLVLASMNTRPGEFPAMLDAWLSTSPDPDETENIRKVH